jgi:predicted ATP-binding protein involved in virulence
LNSPLAIYGESLDTKTNFSSFFEWFKEREDYENEQRLETDEAWRDPELNAVRYGITELTGFTDLRMRRNPLRLEVSKGQQRLNVSQLSDGEKCMLAMVGDLARRLAIANPALNNPLEGRGERLLYSLFVCLQLCCGIRFWNSTGWA